MEGREKLEVIFTKEEVEYIINALNFFLKGQSNAIAESQNVLHVVSLLQRAKKIEEKQQQPQKVKGKPSAEEVKE